MCIDRIKQPGRVLSASFQIQNVSLTIGELARRSLINHSRNFKWHLKNYPLSAGVINNVNVSIKLFNIKKSTMVARIRRTFRNFQCINVYVLHLYCLMIKPSSRYNIIFKTRLNSALIYCILHIYVILR